MDAPSTEAGPFDTLLNIFDSEYPQGYSDYFEKEAKAIEQTSNIQPNHKSPKENSIDVHQC